MKKREQIESELRVIIKSSKKNLFVKISLTELIKSSRRMYVIFENYKSGEKFKINNNDENILLLNGDAIFKFNLKNIYKNHCKKKIGITFLTGEVTYAYGSIGTKNGKIIDFKRNLVFESLKLPYFLF